MNNSTTVVGLDVHKESIVAAVLPAGAGKVSEVMSISNSSLEIRRLVERITRRGAAEFVYEAGPCGYEIWRQITGMGSACSVIGNWPVLSGACRGISRPKRFKILAVLMARGFWYGTAKGLRFE